jgi:mxaJ protein
MSARSLRSFVPALVLTAVSLMAEPGCATAPRPSAAPAAPVLRVCADPNNLPFSSRARDGFENRLAELVAHDLGARLEYFWWPQRRGFVRQTLKARQCDLIIGIPAGSEMLAPTRPYYRSSYVFAWRRLDGEPIRSLDDPRLRQLRIGVPLLGDDGANPPPLLALAERGMIDNVRAYSVFGDYSRPHPPLDLLDALASGEVDVVIAWGPSAGWYAQHSPVPIDLSPVEPAVEGRIRMSFAMAMGVRKGDAALHDRVQAVLDRRAQEVQEILERYGVPREAAGASGR